MAGKGKLKTRGEMVQLLWDLEEAQRHVTKGITTGAGNLSTLTSQRNAKHKEILKAFDLMIETIQWLSGGPNLNIRGHSHTSPDPSWRGYYPDGAEAIVPEEGEWDTEDVDPVMVKATELLELMDMNKQIELIPVEDRAMSHESLGEWRARVRVEAEDVEEVVIHMNREVTHARVQEFLDALNEVNDEQP